MDEAQAADPVPAEAGNARVFRNIFEFFQENAFEYE